MAKLFTWRCQMGGRTLGVFVGDEDLPSYGDVEKT